MMKRNWCWGLIHAFRTKEVMLEGYCDVITHYYCMSRAARALMRRREEEC